jgi:DNA replication and repair protein RecF
MRINKIEILNFKGFDHRTFSFDSPITVLIGDNGIGKTSVLDGLSFADYNGFGGQLITY